MIIKRNDICVFAFDHGIETVFKMIIYENLDG